MQRSTITGHHHMRPDFFGRSHILDLRDGATAVDVLTPYDWEASCTVFVQGAARIAIVCCGPGAPLPLPFGQAERAIRRRAQIDEFSGPICGFSGPDDMTCQLSRGHAASLGDALHAHADEDGLVRW